MPGISIITGHRLRGCEDLSDFQTLPLTTKQNYMLAYPLPALTRDGRLAECEMVAVSSGSNGKPLFWPRSSMHELDIATRFEHVFHGSFHADTARPWS
jgi:phenylacetate-CoA ligase